MKKLCTHGSIVSSFEIPFSSKTVPNFLPPTGGGKPRNQQVKFDDLSTNQGLS